MRPTRLIFGATYTVSNGESHGIGFEAHFGLPRPKTYEMTLYGVSEADFFGGTCTISQVESVQIGLGAYFGLLDQLCALRFGCGGISF